MTLADIKKHVKLGDMLMITDCSNKRNPLIGKNRKISIVQTNALAMETEVEEGGKLVKVDSWFYFPKASALTPIPGGFRVTEKSLPPYEDKPDFWIEYKVGFRSQPRSKEVSDG